MGCFVINLEEDSDVERGADDGDPACKVSEESEDSTGVTYVIFWIKNLRK